MKEALEDYNTYEESMPLDAETLSKRGNQNLPILYSFIVNFVREFWRCPQRLDGSKLIKSKES